MNQRFALVDDELFDAHEGESAHPERPARLHALRQAIASLPRELAHERLAPRDASDEELARVHTDAHIRRIDQAAGLRGHFDADTYYAPRSAAAARRAAGGAIALVEALICGEDPFGVALLRPPGHHATRDQPMGFCLFNNVAVGAAHARKSGIERVAIVDYDVHHGNGTEEIFYEDPNVLYVSLHQANFYPGTGGSRECGIGEGRGMTVNIPLSAGADGAVYLAALERVVAPILHQYSPELLLVSSGFDAHRRDPLGGMRLDDDSYGAMLRVLVAALPPRELGGAAGPPPVGIVLEGGYDLEALAGSMRCVLVAAAAQFSDPRPVVSPTPPAHASNAPLSNLHEAQIDEAIAAQRPFWSLE